jgi:AbrB family looped-hinge helix DNA binding protein
MTDLISRMGKSLISRMGKRGTIVVPAELRERYGLDEGALIIAEEREDGILLRPAVAVPVEVYTPERRAEFLLSNAVDGEDYREAVKEVRAMKLDPEDIPHRRPGQ